MTDCSKPSVVPLWISITFISATLSALIATCIYSTALSKRSRSISKRVSLLSLADYDNKTKHEQSQDQESYNSDHFHIDSDQKEEKDDLSRNTIDSFNSNAEYHCNNQQKMDKFALYLEDKYGLVSLINMMRKQQAYDIPTAMTTENSIVYSEEEHKSIYINETNYEKNWDSLTCFEKLKNVAQDAFGRKNVYLPLVLHLSDTATDFAAVAEFYIVAKATTPQQCGDLNMWWLFILSVICMLAYRIISSFTIYRITKSPLRVMLQFIDVELYHILYISHLLDLKGKSSPQRLISTIEAVFEAAPQSLIQFIYLMKAAGNISTTVVLSVIFSFFNLTLPIVGDDMKLLEIKFKENKAKFMQIYVYRLLDIPSKILALAFLWYFLNGLVCLLVVIIDISVSVYMFHKTKNTNALLSIVAVPFSFGSKQHGHLLRIAWVFSIFETIIINIVIWVFAVMHNFHKEEIFIIVLWLFCTTASVMKCWATYRLFSVFDEFCVMNKERTDINRLLYEYKFEDAMELIIFKTSNISVAAKRFYIAHDNSGFGSIGIRKYSLLAIAAGCDNTKLYYPILKYGGLDEFNDGYKTKYFTGLMTAVCMKNIKCIKTILAISNNDYTNKKNPLRQTALKHAINSGSFLVIKTFLNGVDTNKHLDNIMLLNDLRKDKGDGWNVLHEICADSQLPEDDRFAIFEQCCRMYETNISIAIVSKDKDGRAPLDICRENRNTTIIKDFIEEIKCAQAELLKSE
eukprot:136186_1